MTTISSQTVTTDPWNLQWYFSTWPYILFTMSLLGRSDLQIVYPCGTRCWSPLPTPPPDTSVLYYTNDGGPQHVVSSGPLLWSRHIYVPEGPLCSILKTSSFPSIRKKSCMDPHLRTWKSSERRGGETRLRISSEQLRRLGIISVTLLLPPFVNTWILHGYFMILHIICQGYVLE